MLIFRDLERERESKQVNSSVKSTEKTLRIIYLNMSNWHNFTQNYSKLIFEYE